MTYFSDEQITLLLKPIHPNRVLQLKGMSYVEGHDIRAELSRIFGFGRWSEETRDQQLVCETETSTKSGSKAWYVVYRTRIRLTVRAPDGTEVCCYEGAHVGESTHPVRGEAHGNALTNSQTYALRRCAINLGDQFGLSLYNKGSEKAIVRWTLVRPEKVATDTDDVPKVEPQSFEEPQMEASEDLRATSPPVRLRPSKVKLEEKAEPRALAQVVQSIGDARTVDDLRDYWKEAGALGILQTEFKLGEEKLTVQEFLYRKNDMLSPAKSDDTRSVGAGEGPGTGTGAE